MDQNKPVIYLIPTPLQPNRIASLPDEVLKLLPEIEGFIVEKTKLARRFLKAVNPDRDIGKVRFVTMDKSGDYLNDGVLHGFLKQRKTIGLMSDGGMPCIADPGMEAVKIAREFGYRIKPLSGPSSILMALMASGLNGQQFCFHGYLPIRKPELLRKIKAIGQEIRKTGATQIFIETPYRNQRLLDAILENSESGIQLCVACGIDSADEWIRTNSVGNWKQVSDKNIFSGKVPAVFLLGR